MKTLQENKDIIDAYTWYGRMGTFLYKEESKENIRPIAFADVYGNEAPELIFMKPCFIEDGAYDNSIANLVVCTFEDSVIKTLYDKDLDWMYPYGTDYCVFTGKDRSLYIYQGIGDAGWTYHYYCLTASNDSMSVKDDITENALSNEPKYYQFDSEISKEEYETIRSTYYDNMDNILIGTHRRDLTLDQYANEHGATALTYDEAVKELEMLLGTNHNTESSSTVSESFGNT